MTLLIVTLFLGSCSEDIMDDINKNVNDPADVESKLIITDMMTSSAFSVAGSDLAFYASCYIEHNVGVYNQMYNAEIRGNEPKSSTTYNNSWSKMYNNLYNLKTVINKCSKGGTEEGNYHTLGIAQILSAYNWATLTDLMGNVPYKEALQPGVIFTPKIDSQESIYTEIFKYLDDAIENLSKKSSFSSLGKQDLYYNGDTEKWIKLAYGLKARYTMRLSLKSPKYADVITYANKSFADASEQCQFAYNGTSSKSPFYQFYTDRNYFGASKSFHDKLTERNDPRDTIYFKAPKKGVSLEFAPNGKPEQNQDKYGISGLSSPTAPSYIMTYHELEFLKAEANARLNNLTDAKEALKKAIVASCAKVNVGISSADAEAYYKKLEPRFTDKDATLDEIMMQKYIACYEEEAIEAYNDVRRLKAMGHNPIKLENTLQFPLRFTYGAADVTANVNVKEAYGDGSYVYTENVWWAGGSR